MHTITSAPVPLHPGRVDPNLPRTAGRSAAGEVNQCRSSSRRAPRPPQSPGQSPALPPAPRGGWLGPAPLPDATTCARSGAAFVRRFTAKRAPRARPDPAPGPRGAAARRAGQGRTRPDREHGVPLSLGGGLTTSTPPAPPRTRPPLCTVSAGPPAAHTRFSNRFPSVFGASLPLSPIRSGLHYPPPQRGPHPQPPHPAITGQLPAREGAPNLERAIPRRRPRPRPLASGTAMGEGARRGGGARGGGRGLAARALGGEPATPLRGSNRRPPALRGPGRPGRRHPAELPPCGRHPPRPRPAKRAAPGGCHLEACRAPRWRDRGAGPGGGRRRERAGGRTCFASAVRPSLPGLAGAAARSVGRADGRPVLSPSFVCLRRSLSPSSPLAPSPLLDPRP